MNKRKSLCLTLVIPVGGNEIKAWSLFSDGHTLFQPRNQGDWVAVASGCTALTWSRSIKQHNLGGKWMFPSRSLANTFLLPAQIAGPTRAQAHDERQGTSQRPSPCSSVTSSSSTFLESLPRASGSILPSSPPTELVIKIVIQIHLSGLLALRFYYCFMKTLKLSTFPSLSSTLNKFSVTC